MDTSTTLKSTLHSLESNAFSKKAIDPVFVDDRVSKKKEELIKEFNRLYDPHRVYHWIRDQLVMSHLYKDHRFLRDFGYRTKKALRSELYLYRYSNADTMLDAIEDFLEGAYHLESYYREYENEGVKLLTDIDRKWYEHCANIDDCDTLHMLVRLATRNGYWLKPNRSVIAPIDRCRDVHGYRATDITFFDEATYCGYTRKTDVKKAKSIYHRYRRLMKRLKREYASIAEQYTVAYPSLKDDEEWREKLREIDKRAFGEDSYW